MCLLTIDPVPKKGSWRASASPNRRGSLPPEPLRIVGKPSAIATPRPVPAGNIDYAGGWIPGQAHAEAQAEKVKKNNDALPSSSHKMPSRCCEGRRRISNASSVSIRSLRQVKRKLEDIYRRQKEEKVKEQERWEHELRERVKDRLNLEKLEKELDRERQRRRGGKYFDGPYRGWDWKGY